MNSRDRRRRDRGHTAKSTGRPGRLALGLVLIALSFLPLAAQDDAAKGDVSSPAARRVTVPLPLGGADDDQVLSQIYAAVARFPKRGTTRPLLILDFQSREGTAGEGTEFEAALKIARALTSDKLSGVRTVAFVPRSVTGHGVLPVIACDEIVIAPEAELGAAGIDESEIGPVLRASYEDIADRRRTVPKSLALAMLDRRLKLLKVQTLEGSRVILDTELPELEKTTTISATTTLSPEGDLASFTGNSWRHDLAFASHLASDHQQLAAALNISPAALDDNPLAGQEVKAVRIDFDGPVSRRMVDRKRKILLDQVKQGDVNLVILWIRSDGGTLDDAVEMAHLLTFAVDRKLVRTVAYVSTEARGSAALIALACDELVMEQGAVLGGEGVADFSQHDFDQVAPRVKAIMAHRGRTWSPPLALAGHTEPVRRFSQVTTAEKLLMSDAEHGERDDRDDWSAQLDALPLNQGVGVSDALAHGLAQHRASTFDDVRSIYQIDGEIETASVNWALQLIERLADRKLSGLLLFIGTFALFSELSQPGLGVPGFIAAVCFLLFFWANFLHGNADLLELLLFVVGLACVLIEVFIAPGTMVFGIGGALMIVVSIVLASQTFVIPTNLYQMQQLPGSLLMVAGAGAGGIVGIIVLQRFLPHTPYFKRLILRPPEEQQERNEQRERIASLDYLLGKRGLSLTPLVPAGKAQFGDTLVDVISDGPLIEAGQHVTVIETLGNRVRVRVIEG